MSTVAPSAPAPVVVDASASGAKGESTDPAAFAAEFESALGELTAATTAPTDATAALPADTTVEAAATPAAAPVPAPVPTLAAPALPEPAELPTAAAPAAPADPAAPVAAPVAEALPVAAPVLAAEAAAPAVAVAVADAAPADSDDDTDAGTDAAPDASADAPAPADAAPALAAALPLPLPAPVQQLPAAGPSTDEPAPLTVAAIGAAPAADAAAAATPDSAAAAPAPVAVATPAPAVAAPPAPDEVAAPAAPARAQAPDLVGQLARPLHGLRSFGDGTHIITVRVTPENLGPVAVRAHVSGDSMRIELVAPTDQARDAIKAILPDLRRDLSGAGGQATLDLSSGNQPSGRDSAPRDTPAQSRGTDSGAAAPAPRIRSALRSDAGLDVLA